MNVVLKKEVENLTIPRRFKKFTLSLKKTEVSDSDNKSQSSNQITESNTNFSNKNNTTMNKQKSPSENKTVLSFEVNSCFQNDSQSDDVDFFNSQLNKIENHDLTEFYESPQVLRQIENIINDVSASEIKNTNSSSHLHNEKQPKKLKLSEEIHKIVEEVNENWNESFTTGISQLFKSSEYKRELSNVFDNLETTICQITDGQDAQLQKDLTFNNTQIIDNIDWTEEFSQTQDIGAAIKRALISNAQNPQTNTNIDESVHENKTFINMGPFYQLPLKVKDLIRQYKGIEKLYDWQVECLKLDAIMNRRNLVYALPTSGGKTLVSEILILKEIMCRKRNVIFVLPYVSIVQEKVWALSPFALALDFLVEEYAAGKGILPPRKRRYKHSVYVATMEKALVIINSLMELDRLNEIGLVIVDELHLMGEQSRGVTLEILLTKLIYTKEDIHIIGMSATIGNLPEICKFLNAELYTNDFRPVELKEYVKCENEIAEVNRKAKNVDEILIPCRTVNFPYTDSVSQIDPDRLCGLVMEVVPLGSCLVFCASKKNCENVALLLCRIMFNKFLEHKKAEKESLINMLRMEGTLCPVLKRTLPFGVAYHHSGLTSDERRLIEDAFRIGTLCVICCTSTLAAGVNLPAKRVILRSPYIGREFINLARYKQMIGRAGRAGMEEIGESILICNKSDLRRVTELLCSPMDVVESKMCDNDSKGLRDLVLNCISLGTATNRRKLHDITNYTLMKIQESKLEQNVENFTDNVINDFFKFGAVQLANDKCNHNNNTPEKMEDDSRLVVSKLGRGAIKGGLDLETAHILYEDLVQAQASLVLLDCLHLLYLVTPYDIARQIQPSLPHYYSIYVQLGAHERQTARILGLNEACEIGMLTGRIVKTVNERVLNRFYLTLILHDLWNGNPVFEVADKFQVSRGIVQQLTLSAATFASNVVRFCEELDEFWAFVELLRGISHRLQNCSARELVPLMELPSVKQARARQLYAAGYKTLQNIAKANPNDLMSNIPHMSRRCANQLIASAKLLLLERVENLREEAEDVLEGIEVPEYHL